MNLPLLIARRYLFSKKSTNAINIISGISIFGLSIGTAALVLVLSVFNGFEDLITGMFSNFNPDVKVIPYKGKTFASDAVKVQELRNLDGVEFVSESLEEVAYFEYKGSQDFGVLKGVDEYFHKVTELDKTIREGGYQLQEGERELAVLGVGMRNKLAVNVDDYFSPITAYMLKPKKVGALGEPFRKRYLYPAGTFVIQQDFDNRYILSSLALAQEILSTKDQISSLEIKLVEDTDEDATLKAIQSIMGEEFEVRNRYNQNQAFLKLMNIEKWMSFAILSLTLLLVAFNLIGSLWMIVLEKKQDISILKSMGADNSSIRNIFLSEGLLLCLLGLFIGFALAIFLYLIQTRFGVVPIPDGFVIDSYPISMRLWDFIIVGLTVVIIGVVASIPPALRAQRISAMVRND